MASKDDFQNFIRDYIKTYSLKSITYLEFRQHFIQYVQALYKDQAAALLAKIDWDSWIKVGGANPSAWNISFTTPEAQKFEQLAKEYISLNGNGRPQNWEIYKNETNPNLKVIFLNYLIANQNQVSPALMM